MKNTNIIYEDEDLTIKFRTREKVVLSSQQNFFSDIQRRFFSHEVKATLIYYDEQGNILPQKDWFWKEPFPEVLEHFQDGSTIIWKATGRGGYYNVNEDTTLQE